MMVKANSRMMRKVAVYRDLPIEHEGRRWIIDASQWRGDDGKGELRVHRVQGDITSSDLAPALQLHADALGLSESRFVI